MHCLNRIRKSFYPEHYFPDQPSEDIEDYMNHFLDVLRQAILCHGDISIVYWWNSNYTYIDETGARQHTEEYLRLTPKDRFYGAFTMWDTEVQCRDMDAINAWKRARAADDVE
ncbi:hypothetical protein BDV29DRAFT_154568 [Aspergillus leporis]|uniref:Uncharacterized protein n=1 Tax=Aspergillus leporis TaxID=41062 RepID=A0A5N5X718_9EURO|nr:hypothetical protein BDV29DRAFT_154568 [Aspergillus leporis]